MLLTWKFLSATLFLGAAWAASSAAANLTVQTRTGTFVGILNDTYRDVRQFKRQNGGIPGIVGTTAREASPFLPCPFDNLTAGPSPELIEYITQLMVCNSHSTSVARNEQDLQTWCYEWAGNFTNISPVPWLGAYHCSGLYMFFGTYLIALGATRELEMQTSEKLEDLMLDFVRDPASLAAARWPEHATNATDGGTVAQFGAGGQTVRYVSGESIDGACYIPGAEHDTTP